MEARALVARDRIAEEILGGEIMPDAQKQRILQRIGQMSPDLEPSGDQELVSRDDLRKSLVAAIPQIVKRNVTGDEEDDWTKRLMVLVADEVDTAFYGEESDEPPVNLTEFVLKAFERCLDQQAELLEEAFLARHEEPTEEIIRDLVSDVLRELNGLTVNDLSPFERRRVEESVETARDRIFP